MIQHNQHLKNRRGIFLVNKVRSIVIKLIYLRNYEKVDVAMTDSNMGARKNRRSVNNNCSLSRLVTRT